MGTMRSDPTAALGAALVLVVGMGMGRFAFTGLYPLMVADGSLSMSGGSHAASANYGGYLVGALLAGAVPAIPRRVLCTAALLATCLGLGALAVPLPESLIIGVRALAGIASAFAMVAASHWLIHDRHQGGSAPALFAGVGIGIALSAELIVAGRGIGLGSGSIWAVLAGAGLLLAAIAWLLMRRAPTSAALVAAPASAAPAHASCEPTAVRLISAYGLAGFGYILTATYLPLLVRDALGTIDPVHVWTLFGVVAAPSCFLWHRWHVRWGTRRALGANLCIQALGVVLPAIAHAPAAYIASAALVGGTFLGTVTIAMPAARRLAASVRFSMPSIMTASYGTGQVAGPLVADAIYASTRSFDASLALAGMALLAAAAVCAGGAGGRLIAGPSSSGR